MVVTERDERWGSTASTAGVGFVEVWKVKGFGFRVSGFGSRG